MSRDKMPIREITADSQTLPVALCERVLYDLAGVFYGNQLVFCDLAGEFKPQSHTKLHEVLRL
jgi:hypothetical protein